MLAGTSHGAATMGETMSVILPARSSGEDGFAKVEARACRLSPG